MGGHAGDAVTGAHYFDSLVRGAQFSSNAIQYQRRQWANLPNRNR